MMILSHMLTHGLFYGVVSNLYLFLMMISLSPRVWGYADYPQAVKDKVPPQTPREMRLAALISLPWFAFILAFPIYSSLALKGRLGGEIPFWAAFLNLAVMFFLATLGDLAVLDWLLISRITPRFVIIPGSEPADYKDFSEHFRGHVRAAMIMVGLALALAAAVSFL